MACIDGPPIELPTLPEGFSLSPPALPAIEVSLELCCKLPTLSLDIPIPTPVLLINPAFLAAINAAIAVAQAFIDQLGLDCPRE